MNRRFSALGAWSPGNINSATPRFWLDAQDSSTLQVATGVSTWVDKLGGGFSPVQATGSRQPTVSTAAFGGRQALRFTRASGQLLLLQDATRVNAFAGGTDTAYEIYTVIQFVTIPGTTVPLCIASSTSTSTYSLTYMITTTGVMHHERRDGVGSDTDATMNGGDPDINIPYILQTRFSGTAASYFLNGTELTPSVSNDVGALSVDRYAIGANVISSASGASHVDAYIGENIGVTGGMSAAERARLISYLQTKWGITW